MKEEIKNYVGIALIIALLLAGYSAFAYVRAYSKTAGQDAYRSIAVSAEGKVVAVPDVAKFGFSVISQGGNDLAQLQQANTKKVNSVIDFLKSKGVKSEDIQTSGYDVSPRYQNYACPETGGPCPPADIVGYEVNQRVSVTVRDFEIIGGLLSGVVQKGANNVSQLQFTLDNPMKARAEAKGKAIQSAREQAEIIAKAGGFRLGHLLSVDEGGMPFGFGGKGGGGPEMGMDARAVNLQAPTIEPGSQEVVVYVTLRYEIN